MSVMRKVVVVDTETIVDGLTVIVARFHTLDEAAQYIGGLADQEKVLRGAYAIDAPERMVNP